MVSKTVLLDLDNTLLGNDMATFLPPYFSAVQKCLGHLASGLDLRAMMHASVRTTQAHQNQDRTIFEAFMADFCRRIGHPFEAIGPLLDNLYTKEYPHLKRYTRRRPEARAIVQHILAEGYQVVIATNPLFPATAIRQRLDWAGVGDLPLALVTHMENCHFSKPDRRYYQEILNQVKGTAPGTWMVGDDPVNDMAPARALGLNTWWITDDADEKQAVKCDQHGSLADFLTWIRGEGLRT